MGREMRGRCLGGEGAGNGIGMLTCLPDISPRARRCQGTIRIEPDDFVGEGAWQRVFLCAAPQVGIPFYPCPATIHTPRKKHVARQQLPSLLFADQTVTNEPRNHHHTSAQTHTAPPPLLSLPALSPQHADDAPPPRNAS